MYSPLLLDNNKKWKEKKSQFKEAKTKSANSEQKKTAEKKQTNEIDAEARRATYVPSHSCAFTRNLHCILVGMNARAR